MHADGRKAKQMKILIVSDTHRRDSNLLTVLDKVGPVDMVVHCGDVEGSEELLYEKAGCDVEMVRGNNDFFSDLPREKEFWIGNYSVFLTHGHNYYVSMDNKRLKEEARERCVDIVMYGHTHRPVIEQEKDLICLNPGSLSYPRQEGHRPSYILMEIDAKGEAHFHLNYL